MNHLTNIKKAVTRTLKHPSFIREVVTYYRNDLMAVRGHYRYPVPILFIAGMPKSGTTWLHTQLAKIPGVLEVHYCAGQDSYLVKVRVADTGHLGHMLAMIGEIPSTRNTNSTIVLRTVKETAKLPIEQ